MYLSEDSSDRTAEETPQKTDARRLPFRRRVLTLPLR